MLSAVLSPFSSLNDQQSNATNSLFVKVLKALQDAVTNHNLAVQPNPPPPEPTPTGVTAVRNHARQMPVHSFQVSQDGPSLSGLSDGTTVEITDLRCCVKSYFFVSSGEDGAVRQTDCFCGCGHRSAALWQKVCVIRHRKGLAWQK